MVSFAAVSVVLVLVFSGERFIRYLGDAAQGELQVNLVFQMMLMVTVGSLGEVLPFAIFVATLIAFGRLYKDNEMTILSACGVGQRAIFKAMFFPIVLSALIAGFFSLYLNPLMVEKSYQLRELSNNASKIAGLHPGSFTQFVGGKYTFYVEGITEGQQTLSRVFLQAVNPEGEDVFVAPSGRKVVDDAGNEFLELRNGYRYHENKQDHGYKVYQYDTALVRLPDPDATSIPRKSRALASLQLLKSDKPVDVAELHWRIATPISAVLLSVLGILFSYTTPRQGRYAKLFSAILLYAVYSNLLVIGQSWIARGIVSPSLGLWWVHALTVCMIIGLIIKRSGLAWTKAVLMGRA